MSCKKYFASFILIFCTVASSFAQDKKPIKENYSEQHQKEQKRAQATKQAEETLAALREAQFPDLNFFLPAAQDSWIVSLTASGGIFGGTRLLAAVNSDGNFLCYPKDEKFKDKFVERKIFDEIALIAKVEFPHLISPEDTEVAQPISYCSDCAQETLTVRIRRNNTIEIFRYRVGAFAKSEPKLGKIYDMILNSRECK